MTGVGGPRNVVTVQVDEKAAATEFFGNFDWGNNAYLTSWSSMALRRLAFALLRDAVGQSAARKVVDRYAKNVVANLADTWSLTAKEIYDWTMCNIVLMSGEPKELKEDRP